MNGPSAGRSFLRPQRACALFGLLLLSSGCIRSVPPIPNEPEGVSLAGRVETRDLASGGLMPLAGVRAELLGTSFRRITDDNGAFVFRRVPLGTYSLLVTSTGAQARSRLVAGIEFLVDGERIDQPTIELGEPRTLEGRVYKTTGTSSAAAGVRVWLVGTPFFTFTDVSGAYRLARVPDPWLAGDNYELAFYRDGFVPSRVLVPSTTAGLNAIPPVRLQEDPNLAEVRVFGTVRLALPQEPSDGQERAALSDVLASFEGRQPRRYSLGHHRVERAILAASSTRRVPSSV